MKTPRALLLYEESTDCGLLRAVLSEEGCDVEQTPLDPHTSVPVTGYHLVLFDIQRMNPGLLGIIRSWRDRTPDTMLIVTGGRTTQANRIAALETGVSAYLIKPLMLPELRARIRAELRRFRSQESRLRCFSIGSGTIDLDARLVRAENGYARLTRTECEILEHLAAHINQTVPSGDLVKTLWGADPQKGVHSLRLFIRKLRNKLEPDPAHPRYLVTEPAIGYRLQVPPAMATDLVNGQD